MTTPPVPSITDELIAEIEQEALMATPGPWEQVGIHVHTKLGAENRAGSLAHHRDGWNIATVNPWSATNADGEDEDLPVIEQMANRAHIANCDPSTVLALITRLRAAEAERNAQRRQVDTLTEWYTAALPGVTYMDPPDGGAPSIPEQLRRMARDAARYRWLRMADWWESPLCAITNPRQNAKLGSDCPSRDRLDTAVDAAMSAVEVLD